MGTPPKRLIFTKMRFFLLNFFGVIDPVGFLFCLRITLYRIKVFWISEPKKIQINTPKIPPKVVTQKSIKGLDCGLAKSANTPKIYLNVLRIKTAKYFNNRNVSIIVSK